MNEMMGESLNDIYRLLIRFSPRMLSNDDGDCQLTLHSVVPD